MSFISPIYLILLPLIIVPILIHLLNRWNVVNIEFSSIRFLKLIEQNSIKRLNILQILLLIIRTLIILAIILMMSRPTIINTYGIKGSDESNLFVFLLDDSFSMIGYKKKLKKSISQLLQNIPDKSTIIWININSGLQYSGLKENLQNYDNYITLTNKAGNLLNSINTLKKIDSNFNYKELYLLSDGHDRLIYDINNYNDYLNEYNSHILIASDIGNNLSIIDANVINEVIIPNDIILMNVKVSNNSIQDKENVLLQLIIDDLTIGQQKISIKANTVSTFEFKTSLPNRDTYTGFFEIENDWKSDDNKFYFTINIPNKYNIGILSSDFESQYYLTESLKVLNKNNNFLSYKLYHGFNDKSLNLMKQNILFVCGPDLLETISDSKLDEFISNNGHVVIFPKLNTNSTHFKNITNLININDDYNDLFLISHSNNSFQTLNHNLIKNKTMSSLFSKHENKGRDLKFFKYFKLPNTPNNTILELVDATSIWNRYDLNNGIIDIFGFPINLNWTNLPIKGSFIPFINYVTYSSFDNNLFVNIDTSFSIKTNTYQKKPAYLIEPDRSKRKIELDENSLNLNNLHKIGIHTVSSDNNIIYTFAVNASIDELGPKYMDIRSINKFFDNKIKIVDMDLNIQDQLNQDSANADLWRWLLYIIIILVIFEMLISNAKYQKQ